MKTHELIAALAEDAAPVKVLPVSRIVARDAFLGAGLSGAVLLGWLGLRDMNAAVATSAFWMKFAFTLSLGTVGLIGLVGLARPGGRSRGAAFFVVAAFSLMSFLALREAISTPMTAQRELWMGHSSPMCLVRIVVLSAPVGAALILALRRAAPTRPGLAGAAAGLAAGGLGATLYGFFCTETAAPFVLLWYSLGIGVTIATGALIGKHALRW